MLNKYILEKFNSNKHLIYSLSIRVITVACSLGASIISARFLGPSDRGKLFFIFTLANLIVQFSIFGVQTSNTYILAKNKALLSLVLSNSIWLSFVSGLFTVIVLFQPIYIINYSVDLLWFIFPISICIHFSLLGLNILIGLDLIKEYNVVSLATNLLLIVLFIISGIQQWDLKGFLFSLMITWLLSVVLLLYIFSKHSSINLKFNYGIFKKGLSLAFKSYLSCVIGFIILRLNVFFIEYFSGSTQLGYYSLGMQFVDALSVFSSTVALLLFPQLVRLKDENRWVHFKKALINSFYILSLLSLFIAILTPFIIKYLFTDLYMPAQMVIYLSLPGGILLGLVGICSQFLASKGYPKEQVIIWILTLVINIPISWVLITNYDSLGAAASLTIIYLILFVFMFYLTKKYSLKKIETDSMDMIEFI